MSGQQGAYGQPPNMPQQQMMYGQQHMMGRPMGQMGVQRQMYAQDAGMPQQQSQMQMHYAPQQQQMQMGQPQMNQMPQLQQQQQQQAMAHQQPMQMGLQQQLGGQQMGMQPQQMVQQQQQMVQQQQQMGQQQVQQQSHAQQGQPAMGQQPMLSGQTQLGSMLGGSLGSVSQQHMQMQQPRSPMPTASVGPQLTPGGAPGSQAPASALAAASVGGPTSVGPLSVQPHTPMNPASQQAIAQPSSVQPGPASVAPATPASNQPAPSQSTSAVEPSHPYLQDPVAHSKQLIMKDLRFAIIDLNRRAGEALKDLRAGNTPSNSNEYLKAMDNLFAVCDEIEGNLILVCETQKQMNKMEKIFDKDALRGGEQHVGFSNSKGRHAAGDDESGAHLSAVNSYIDQTKQLQAAFDRAFSHVGRTLETIRRRQNMSSKIPKIEGLMDMGE